MGAKEQCVASCTTPGEGRKLALCRSFLQQVKTSDFETIIQNTWKRRERRVLLMSGNRVVSIIG
jgi:hypothetical protein